MKAENAAFPADKKITIGNRLVLWFGVLRRFFLYVFNRKYVEQGIAKRKGNCARCGACCTLITGNCVYLSFDSDGKSLCRNYNAFRMPNCRIFPIDNNDIKDRDIVSKKPCGFYF
jgi:hypothetical protein